MKPLSVFFVSALIVGVSAAQSPPPPLPPNQDAVAERDKGGDREKGGDRKNRSLLANGNFGKGTAGWELITWGKNGKMAMDETERHEGRPTLRVENFEPCHSFIRQIVQGKPNTRYRLSGFIKTEKVEPAKSGQKTGAVLMLGD